MTRASKVIGDLVSGVLLAALLAACGSATSVDTSSGTSAAPDATLLGIFTDAPVAGLFYTTNSGSGGCTSSAPCVSDSMGQFKYAPGDTVNFFAAGIYLGSASPSVAADGSTTVTPVSLVPAATSVSDPTVTTIATFLSTLNAVSVATGNGASGVFVIPNSDALVAQLSTVGTLTVTNLQTAITALYPALGITVPSATSVQAALMQGINAQGVIGTVWSGNCTCGGGGEFYFQPNGNLVGITQDGATFSGSWSGLSSGGVSLSLVGSNGAFTQGGAIPSGSSPGAAQVYSASLALQGTYNFTKVVSAAALGNTLYLGGWYASFTPNAAGTAAGHGSGESAYVIAAPDGNLYGLTSDGSYFSGTWNPATGAGTASVTTPGNPKAISVALASGTGSVTNNGQTIGSLTFSRTGSFSMNPGT